MSRLRNAGVGSSFACSLHQKKSHRASKLRLWSTTITVAADLFHRSSARQARALERQFLHRWSANWELDPLSTHIHERRLDHLTQQENNKLEAQCLIESSTRMKGRRRKASVYRYHIGDNVAIADRGLDVPRMTSCSLEHRRPIQ